MTSWLIEAKLKNGTEWEPISVERATYGPGGQSERRFHYVTLYLAIDAFREYLATESAFPHVLIRLATGGLKLLDLYEVRFVATSRDVPEVPWRAAKTPQDQTGMAA